MNERGKSSHIRIAKLRISPTNTNQNRKNFSFHQNSFERYTNSSRRFAPKTRPLSRKNRDLLNKTPLLIHRRPIRPHFLLAPTLLPLYARLRALSEFSFFAFTLHRPPYLPHSWRIRGEGKSSESLHPMQRKKISSRKPNDHHELTGELTTSRAFTFAFTLNILYIKSMQSICFVF